MTDFTCMGDQHLGRAFKPSVPLHRVGEREALIHAQFERELIHVTKELHINLGDMFDKFVVAPEVVLFAADTYARAAKANRNTHYIIMRGNHDVSRDLSRSSSFEIFTRLVASVPNITVVGDSPLVIGDLGFLSYNAFGTAREGVDSLPDNLTRVFTHFDYVDWGGDHVLPTQRLAAKQIFNVTNGHDHLRRSEKRHGVEVEIFGSMQPYGHAEDGTGAWYRTVTLDELQGLDTHLLNLRVLLADGDVLPTDLDCLSLTAKKVRAEDTDLEVDTTEFDSFDIEAEIGAAVDPSILEELLGVFRS